MSAEILRILVVFLGIIVVALILVQQPKDGGISAFTGGGGGASGTVFGSKGSNAFFFRITAITMIVFTIAVVLLVKVGDSTYSSDNSIIQAMKTKEEVPGKAVVVEADSVPGVVKTTTLDVKNATDTATEATKEKNSASDSTTN